jgi:hypothetical protein
VAALPELAKHLGGMEDDISNCSAAISPSEMRDRVDDGPRMAERRRRSSSDRCRVRRRDIEYIRM